MKQTESLSFISKWLITTEGVDTLEFIAACTSIVITDKNTHHLRINVNPTSKELGFLGFMTFFVPTKGLEKRKETNLS